MERRLDVGSIFERLFETYRAQFTLIVPAALIVFLPVAILSAATQGNVAGTLIGSIASLVATYWLQGMVVQAVRDIQDGRRDFDIPSLFQSVVPVLGALILAGVLAAIGIAIGLILLIVPGLILLTWWAVIAPVIVIEERPALQAFGRSRELVRGHGWQVFTVIVVVFLINLVGSALLAVLLAPIGDAVGAGLSTLVGSALLAPIAAIAAALIYLELSAGGRPAGPAAEAVPGGPPQRPEAPPGS
jgi:hypothetical protein